jgi:hypothetical protein
MASFSEIHRKDIEEYLYNHVCSPGQIFFIYMKEPLVPYYKSSKYTETVLVTVISFLCLPHGRYQLAYDEDREALADWEERHKETPAEAWGLADINRPYRGHARNGFCVCIDSASNADD